MVVIYDLLGVVTELLCMTDAPCFTPVSVIARI